MIRHEKSHDTFTLKPAAFFNRNVGLKGGGGAGMTMPH